MAKGKKSSGKSEAVSENSGRINRKKRTSFERRCLTKEMKRMFMGSSKQIFKMVLAAEVEAKKKPKSKEDKK